MSFLDLSGLEKLWQKIVGGFLQKTDTLTDEQIESATTGGGDDSQSLVGGMTVKDYIDTKLENIEANTISANEISITSGNSLILGGDSYDDETEEDDWFEIKCPKRPYFNINGNVYNLPWEETNGVDVDLARKDEVGVEKFRIVGQHRNDEQNTVYFSEDDFYSSLDFEIKDTYYPKDVAFHPVYKFIVIQNFSDALLDSNRFRVLFMRKKTCTRGEKGSRYRDPVTWRVPFFYGGGEINNKENMDWWGISGPIVHFFGSQERSGRDYFKRHGIRWDIKAIFKTYTIGCAIFENIGEKWIRVSNIAEFRLTRYRWNFGNDAPADGVHNNIVCTSCRNII